MARYFNLLFICFLSSVSFGQDWIFEYESEYSSVMQNTWNNHSNENTIHRVGVSTVPGSFKHFRTRLIELNEDGELVSFFKAKDCNTVAMYQPYGQDSIISVSRKCNAEWINTFNIFNSDGERILTEEYENKYSNDHIIKSTSGIAILRAEWKTAGDEFHILEFSPNYKKNKYSFKFNDFQDNDLDIRNRGSVKLSNGEYLLGLQLTETNNNLLTFHYPKLLYVKEGEVKWVSSFEDKLKTIGVFNETEEGFVVQGKDHDKNNLIIYLDKNGIETHFLDLGRLRSVSSSVYFSNGRLFSVNKIRRATILIKEYNPDTGELIYELEVPTNYSRISFLEISMLKGDNIILTGTCRSSSKGEKGRGVVMKVSLLDQEETLKESTTETIIQKVISVEDLVQETSDEVLNIKVYPNPAKFRITFELEDRNTNFKMNLKIFSAGGDLVELKEFIGNSIETDVSNFPKGAYFYSIVDETKIESVSGRFVVQ